MYTFWMLPKSADRSNLVHMEAKPCNPALHVLCWTSTRLNTAPMILSHVRHLGLYFNPPCVVSLTMPRAMNLWTTMFPHGSHALSIAYSLQPLPSLANARPSPIADWAWSGEAAVIFFRARGMINRPSSTDWVVRNWKLADASLSSLC